MKIGIILGSTRPTRISPFIGDWIHHILSENGLAVEIIDLQEMNLPFLNEAVMPSLHQYELETTLQWSTIINGFDGFVLLSPQYNWGYPAVLKNALDLLYDEWRGKPVSIVTYGGHGGFQAALGLGLVVRGLRMRPLATNPQIAIRDSARDSKGQLRDVDALLSPYRSAVLNMGKEFMDTQRN